MDRLSIVWWKLEDSSASRDVDPSSNSYHKLYDMIRNVGFTLENELWKFILGAFHVRWNTAWKSVT